MFRKGGWQKGVHRSNWEVMNKPERTMNNTILYQWEQEIREHLPSLNTWQTGNVALMSYGVIKAEGSQQHKIARQMRGREKVESATRRIRRFLANTGFPLEGFWREWVCWVVKSGGWHWDESLVRQPDHVTRLLGILVVAYCWTIALGSQAIYSQGGHPLIRCAQSLPERSLSLFREGLDFLCQHLEGFSRFCGIVFFPNFRFS
ncbi:MAG: hypothetical protein ABI947_04865 [Chloroflexota bacterium]